MSTLQLTTKQSVLVNKLTTKLTRLSQFIQAQGISPQHASQFILLNVFQIPSSQQTRSPKLSKDFSSQTQEETNSETSESSELEISLQKVLIHKLTEGNKMDKILIGYLERCCVEYDRLKNYLKSEETQQAPRASLKDFQKLREKIGLTKHRKPRQEYSSIFQSSQLPAMTTQMPSIRQRIEVAKHRSVIEESQRQLDYMRFFEKSLSESIRKTQLLRSMLQKQLASEFSPLSLLRANDEEINSEVY